MYNVLKTTTILIIAVMFSYCNTNLYRQGETRNIDQVKFHNNQDIPFKKVKEYLLKEILSIGTTKVDTNYTFSRIVDLEVDKKGNIYVLDYGNKRIQKYDHLGKYLLAIKPEVEHIKNFKDPVAIELDSRDNLIVMDEGNLLCQIFTPLGKFKKQFSIQGSFFTDLLMDSKDNIIIADTYIALEESTRGTKFQLYDRDGNFLLTICDKHISDAIQKGMLNQFGGTINGSNHLYVANLVSNSNYQIDIYDLKGEFLSKINRTVSRIPYTLEEKEQWIKRKGRIFGESRIKTLFQFFPPLEYKPLILGLFFINGNTLWVKTSEKKENDTTVFDEFDNKGRFVRKIILRGAELHRPLFLKNRIYDFTAPFEETQCVKVYER